MHPEARRIEQDPSATAARYGAVVRFPAMTVGVRVAGGAITELRYLPPTQKLRDPSDALLERAVRQLERYRDDPDAPFELPLAIQGSDFQKSVWQALVAIPRGRTLTYGQMAKQLGSAARAVGQACGSNRLPVVIPCHRVIAAQGLGGFGHRTGGYMLEAKRWLLVHEGALAH